MRAIVMPPLLPLLVVLMAVGRPASAQVPKDVDDTIRHGHLYGYRTLVEKFRAGDASAVDALLTWRHELIQEVIAMLNGANDPKRPWDLDDVKAAVLMHTGAALRLLGQNDDDSAKSEALFQLDIAGRALLRGADPFRTFGAQIDKRNAEVRAFASRWYVGLARLLRDRLRVYTARRLLAFGRARLPGNAAVLFESGALEEFFASRPSERLARNTAGYMTLEYGAEFVRRSLEARRQQLTDAERWLRQSAALAPSSSATQLHLGRVLMLGGNDEEAAGLLGALPHDASREEAYLAAMYVAAIHDRRGTLDNAETAYRKALAIYPGAQSAIVALSAVLQRLQRGDEARAVLQTLFAPAAAAAEDPWWHYFFEPAPAVTARIDALYSEVFR